MSFAIMRLVWRAKLDSTTKLVAARLADIAGDDGGNVYPSQSRVAAETGLSIRAVRDAFRRLEQIGVLVLVHGGDAARHVAKEYRFNVDALAGLPVAFVPNSGIPEPGPSGTSCRPAPAAARHHVPDPPAGGAGPSGTSCRQSVIITTIEPSERLPPSPPTPDLFEHSPAPAPPDADALFAEWWTAVPVKKAKGAAQRAYRTALKHATPAELLTGIRRYADEVRGREARFIAHPATWLNGQRWLDEPGRQGVDHAQRDQAARPIRNGFIAVALEEAERRHQDAGNDPGGWNGPAFDLDPAGDGGA